MKGKNHSTIIRNHELRVVFCKWPPSCKPRISLTRPSMSTTTAAPITQVVWGCSIPEELNARPFFAVHNKGVARIRSALIANDIIRMGRKTSTTFPFPRHALSSDNNNTCIRDLRPFFLNSETGFQFSKIRFWTTNRILQKGQIMHQKLIHVWI